MRLLVFLGLLALSACATSHLDYDQVLEKNTDQLKKYSGFHNIIDMEGTLLTSTVMAAQVEHGSNAYQWDSKKTADEKAQRDSRINKETELFLSFYTPDRKNNDLSKNNSVWRVFLDVDGRRYEGKIKKINLPLSEVQGFYHYHNRFYTPYSVIFLVPMKSIEGKKAQVTVTGVVGTGTLNFF